MKLLFVLHYPGYLRFFDSSIRLLADRGHHVLLAFDSSDKQPEGVEALLGATGVIERVERPPPRGDSWDAVAQAIRGCLDYARYLDPRFADSPYLRDRMRKVLPPVFAGLGWFNTAGRRTTSTFVRWLTALEDAVPSSVSIERYLRRLAPDVLVVSPLVMPRLGQVDAIKSARAVGIPSALCVASWDHLTTKGLMRVQPDSVVVWNEAQRREAVELHGTPSERVVVTGAQPFDRWFDRVPSLDRQAFCRKVGLPADRPFILFVGSTLSISGPDAEVRFVRRWVRAVRAATDSAVREVGLLVRPHPYNFRHWVEADMSDLTNVKIYPRHSGNPVNELDRADYFDSLYHSAAVVGVNTSAMIEAAIVGRPVHTVLADEFSKTQMGTLHFRHLLPANDGFLIVATNLVEHVTHLEETLRWPDRRREAIDRFVKTFVRPNGLERPCTPQLADALEQLAARAPGPHMHRVIRGWPGLAQLRVLRGVMWVRDTSIDYGNRLDRAVRHARKAVKIQRKAWVHFRRRRVAALRRAVGAHLKALRRLIRDK